MALLLLSGCAVFGGSYTLEEPIGQQRANAIIAGKTTVREVLTRLGPPTAVVRRDSKVVCPNIGSNACGPNVPPASFFDFFPAASGTQDVIYYYQSTRINSTGFVFLFIIVNGGGMADVSHAEQLLLLVNEQTGMVEGLAYRPG